MATYSSYKKIITGQVLDGTVPNTALQAGAALNWNTLHVFGPPGMCTGGCCCLWTVPSGVTRATFELWGAGGNGNGACSTSRCQHFAGAGGGFYNSKTISVTPGWTYTICAGGVHPCMSIECLACYGCSSYVNGCGLSNFCAVGGAPGCANSDWSESCYTFWCCCIDPNANNGDFGMGNHTGAVSASIFCHCNYHWNCTTNAPFLAGGSAGAGSYIYLCWMRCGCWSVPYAAGGQSAMTTYCGGNSCCGQGATGGSGLVKVTFT